MEEDHFEDFTAASEWESFTARLEQLLIESLSKAPDPAAATFNWLAYHDKIAFADFQFKFSYFRRLPETSSEPENANAATSSTNFNANRGEDEPQLPEFLDTITRAEVEFPPTFTPHCLSEYFNVSEFAVLSPAGIEHLEKESRLKVILSSACIAVNNCTCGFPVFVQFQNRNLNYFCGIAESCGIRSSLDMVRLLPGPATPNHLSGLLELMKGKIGGNLPCSIGISAHFFYKIGNWPADINLDSFPPELFDLLQGKKENRCESQHLTHTAFLPFGSLDDPFSSLDLVAGWPQLTEDVVVDSPSYSDLEPENAQEWYYSFIADRNAEFRLCELLDGVWKLQKDKRNLEQVLGKPLDNQLDAQDFASALDKITRPKIVPKMSGINTVLGSARRSMYYNSDPSAFEDLAPLRKDQMDSIMEFFFPDAKPTSGYPYPDNFQDGAKFKKDALNILLESLAGIKSVPVGSVIWRLSIMVAYLLRYSDHASPSVVAYLWAEFILELRFRVENSKHICGLEPGSPNIGTSLLNQKLQMLNCCIEQKIARESKQAGTEDIFESNPEDSDDEFFDCEDDVPKKTSEIQKVDKPVGRLRKNGKLKLLETGEFMYIPETQDPAPLTEDVLEEQSRVMISLGDDAQGSELRAKMMSASLHSDMESFKAANPGAILEDFVRWYSPRDWIESEEVDKYGNVIGELSPRMRVKGNLWSEVWSTAKAVPARRQKRLFDDTKEAEKVLHWLATRTLQDISELIFPSLVHASIIKILDEVDALSVNYEVPASLLQNAVQLSRSFHYVAQLDGNSDDVIGYKNLVLQGMLQCEREISQIKSFQLKFPTEDVCRIVDKSGGGTELFPKYFKVLGGKRSELGTRIFDLFVKNRPELYDLDNFEHEKKAFSFGNPYRRVFVLKYSPKHYDRNSSVCLPQRMSCVLTPDMFLVSGTFSTKTTFM